MSPKLSSVSFSCSMNTSLSISKMFLTLSSLRFVSRSVSSLVDEHSLISPLSTTVLYPRILSCFNLLSAMVPLRSSIRFPRQLSLPFADSFDSFSSFPHSLIIIFDGLFIFDIRLFIINARLYSISLEHGHLFLIRRLVRGGRRRTPHSRYTSASLLISRSLSSRSSRIALERWKRESPSSSPKIARPR